LEISLPMRYDDRMIEASTTLSVAAHWDEDAKVFYSESDIPGLCVEAATFDSFVEIVEDLARDVIATNLPDLAAPYVIRIATARTLTLAA
jgi:Domain of unknown function (DUF1902)